jgi:hypothetical protein
VRQALEFYKKLIAFLPPDVAAPCRRQREPHSPATRKRVREDL